MLADKDRIFANIYGLDDPFMAGARKRGNWDGTKKILKKGREQIVEDIKNSGLRGRGGAGAGAGRRQGQRPLAGSAAGAGVPPRRADDRRLTDAPRD